MLAHLFINHMLDPEVAMENFSAIGYQPPQNTITPDSLVADEFIPENLRSADRQAGVLRHRLPAARADAGERRRVAASLAGLQGRRSRPWRSRCHALRGRLRRPQRRIGCGRCWPLPGIVWLLLFFLFPLYVVLCIVFGQIDPLFRTPVPVWNPLQWDPTQFTYVLTPHRRRERRLRPGAPAHLRSTCWSPARSAC